MTGKKRYQYVVGTDQDNNNNIDSSIPETSLPYNLGINVLEATSDSKNNKNNIKKKILEKLLRVRASLERAPLAKQKKEFVSKLSESSHKVFLTRAGKPIDEG